MKVVVDKNVSGETPELQKATKDSPVKAKIIKVELIAAEDLPEQFENRDDDRYQIVVLFDGSQEELKWMPNKTSLKLIVAGYGDESDNWAGKTLNMYRIDQAVAGKMKKIVYCEIPAQTATTAEILG